MSDTRAPKIGVLIDCLHESYQSTIWKGLSRAAAEKGVQLLSFVATSQDRTSHFHVHYPVIRDIMNHAELDGIIALAGSISEHHGVTFTRELLQTLTQVPVMCISLELPGFSSVIVDNSHGIRELIAHLVEVHNLHRIAFIKGPEGHQEAEARFLAYREALDHWHIPFDPQLTYQGDFSKECGKRAAAWWCENDIDLDAIIAADDKAALGVIEELKDRKIHVPTEIAVAGFDDIEEAGLSLPPLTTVRQPLERMGAMALENLLAIVQGRRDKQGRTRLPTTPVYRRSCGCFGPEIRHARHPDKQTVAHMSAQQVVARLMESTLSHCRPDHPAFPGEDIVTRYIENLVDSLVWDVEKDSIREIFLNEVDMLLFRMDEYADTVSLLNAVLTDLSAYIPALFKSKPKISTAASILQQAQALVREHKLNFTQTSHLHDTLFQLMIRETSQAIITTFEQRKLLEAISASFPNLHIESLVFATYDKNDRDVPLTADNWDFPQKSRLLLAYDRKTGVIVYPRGDNTFPTKQLYPDDMFSDNARNLVFMPLFFEDEHLGYTIFEHNAEVPLFMYEELRLHISSALKSSFLMRDLRIASMLDELTGLHNRRGFVTEAKKLFRYRKKGRQHIMMFYADMDDLKVINDTWGHEEGDVAIVGTASVLRQAFREGDIVARIGGDEFVAILAFEDARPEELEATIRERIRIALEAYNTVTAKPYELSMSVGVTYCGPNEESNLDTLMRQADERLLERKKHKKRGRLRPSSPPPA